MTAVPVTIGLREVTSDHTQRFSVEWGQGYDVCVVNVGLACCAVEFLAAAASRPDALSVAPDDGESRAALLVVSGTVTDKMAPAIKRMYDALPEPRYVISFGSCANCGGPYWDSYCVTKGVDQLIPVDVYVPGCPPRPEALLDGIAQLEQRLGGDPHLAGEA
jgi:NADH-quinone oxidoreductase subunit B